MSKEKIKTKELSFDCVAYDIVWDDELRSFFRIDVEYNSATGDARVKTKKVIADSQPVATMKMNHLFTKKILKLDFE